MSIVGIGTDIVDIDRIWQIYQRHPEKFISRILAKSEIQEFENHHNKAAFLAKRFAAKEASAKALGTGIGTEASFKDFCVKHSSAGKPILEVSGTAEQSMKQRGINNTHISLSDEVNHALAFVIFETLE